MTKYTIAKLQDANNANFFAILENKTEHILGFYCFLEDAEKRVSFLESGGAFDGFTPSFVLIETNKKTDINDDFSKL